MGNKQIEIDDATKCYVCGAKEKVSGNSLHCWDVEYDCGCKIWGPIGDEAIFLDVECTNSTDKSLK